ncbi:hypothetical protein V8E53_005164 [Lactarius tabidus]
MSSNWAWKEADIIPQNPETHSAMLVPLVLGSDKTTVSVATGQNEYYPLYLSIGNVCNHVHRAHGSTVVVLRFLAIPKSNLGPYIADYPEQALLTCIIQGWCPCCTVQTGNAVNIIGKHWSQELTEALVYAVDSSMLWDQFGIIGDVTPFTSNFPQADIYKVITPNILHQVIKGTFKDHLVTWVEEYLILVHSKMQAAVVLDDINCHIALAPAFLGLRRFPQGHGFKQWTGNDLKVLMKVYLPALEGHMPLEIICAFCAFLDFCYLCHAIFQVLGQICFFGAPNGLCSSITESKHIPVVKKMFCCSNHCRALGQILLRNQQQDKVAVVHRDFESQGMLRGEVLPDACTHAGIPATVFRQHNFHKLVQHFLFDQVHLNDINPPSSSDVTLEECLPFNSPISVYHSMMAVFYSPSNPSIPRICGLDIVRLLALFSFVWRALHQWFKHTAKEVDVSMGMWVVQPDNNANGSPAVRVIHLYSVLCTAHLMPVFGNCFIPHSLTPDHTLDVFQLFYVNKYINYHAFELAS